jgi:hypothetical protein
MTDRLEELLHDLDAADREMCYARQAFHDTDMSIRALSLERFMASLAARGIEPGGNIVVDGLYSGVSTMTGDDAKLHDATPVHFRSAATHRFKTIGSDENSIDNLWAFRVSIARLDEDGEPFREWRQCFVEGDTPEDAASKIGAAQAKN